MRTFDDISTELDLKPWLRTHVGRFHLTRDRRPPRTLVRHFDTDDVAHLVTPYAELVDAVHQWITARPDVAELVSILTLTEIGHDFVARPFHVYLYALNGYDDPEEWDLVDVIPEELTPMRQRIRANLTNGLQGRDRIIQDIIVDSLLGPSPSTVMTNDGWLIVSPRITIDQLQHWTQN